MNTYQLHNLTRKIIKDYYVVYDDLGTRFLESVYGNAMLVVLRDELELSVQPQVQKTVFFRDKAVGKFRADLVVENKVIVELKAVTKLLSEHEAQLINYLKAIDIELGLLMNFGDKPKFKRFIFNK